MDTVKRPRELAEQMGTDRSALIALLFGALMFAAMMPGTSRGTEQRGVYPCHEDCQVSAYFTIDMAGSLEFEGYDCRPGGKWLCPLTNKDPQIQE